MQMHKQSTQFDPSQYISKKHYRYQKGGAQKRPTYRLGGGGDEEVVDKIL